MKNPATFTFTEEEMGKITFDMNTSVCAISRIGQYVRDHKGEVDKTLLVSWSESLVKHSEKILKISENLTK
jgi:hypothetical protein